VPVTVAREVDGDQGSLQFLPSSIRNETERAESGRGGDAWCPLTDQWNAMYIFDALIYNRGRPPTNMLYSQDNWQMILAGYADTFGTRKGRPPYLAQAKLKLTDEWKKKLSELDEAALTETMGSALDKRRVEALVNRRDDLLESK